MDWNIDRGFRFARHYNDSMQFVVQTM